MNTSLLLGICAALYFFTVFTYLPARPGMAVAFFGYFLANGGLIYDAITYPGVCK